MLDEKLLQKLKKHIANQESCHVFEKELDVVYNVSEMIRPLDLREFVDDKLEPAFQEVLFRFIDQKKINDSDVYKKAWLDRKHFSKIRSDPNYKIGKNSVIALAMALELTQEETDELLQSAGFALSNNNKTDLVIQFCVEHRIYSLYDINDALVYLNLKPLSNIN